MTTKPGSASTQSHLDPFASLFDSPSPGHIGLLTVLLIALYVLIQRHKDTLMKIGGAGVWLVKGGFSLWVETKLLSETNKRMTALEAENQALKAENIRLVGYIEGVKAAVTEHDERLRHVEVTKAEHGEKIMGLRVDLDRTALNMQIVSQNLGEISANIARLTAHRDADLLINAEQAEDIREIRRAILKIQSP